MASIKGKLKTSDYMSFDEFIHLCECLHKDELYFWELYIRLSFCTALRVSDVLSIMWRDILGERVFVKVEKKTGKTRPINFSESVVAKINTLYCSLGSPDVNTLIFNSSRTGKHYTPQYINRKLKYFKMKYRLSVNSFSTHSLRKSFGRHVYESHNRSAESLIKLNEIFQHESLKVTQRYIGLTRDEINEVYDSLEF